MEPPLKSLSDPQLLDRFAADGDQGAFSELVQRYAGLVHGAALRVTGDAAAAMDAGQHTFILLARKAPLLKGKASFARWLHRTAVNAGREVVRSERRRAKREQTAAFMDNVHSSAPAVTWEEVAPQLDRLLGGLAAGDRDLILLRYVQGHTFREAGSLLQMSEEAARKRITRALEKLRAGLARAGIILTGAGLSGMLTAEAKAAVSSETVRRFATACAGIRPSPIWMRLSGKRGMFSGAAAALLTSAPVCFVVSPPPSSLSNAAPGALMRIADAAGAAADRASAAAGESGMTLEEIIRRLKAVPPPESDEWNRDRTLTDYRRDQLVKRLRAADFPKALEMAQQSWDAHTCYFVGPDLVRRWAEFQPEAAMDWIRDQRPAWRNGALRLVRRHWEKTDPRAMFRWMAREMAAHPAASTMIDQVIPGSQQVYLLSSEAIKNEPEEFLRMVAGAKSAARRREAIGFGKSPDWDPLKQIEQFSDPGQRELLLREALRITPPTLEYIESIPAGPFRDGLVVDAGRLQIQSGPDAETGADWMLGNLPTQHRALALNEIVDAWMAREAGNSKADAETRRMVSWLEASAPSSAGNDEVWARVVAYGGEKPAALELAVSLAGRILDPALREWALASAYTASPGGRKTRITKDEALTILQNSGIDSETVSRVLEQAQSFPFPQP